MDPREPGSQPVIDYTRLNDAAKLLYDVAHTQGFHAGEQKQLEQAGRASAISMLEVIDLILIHASAHPITMPALALAALGKVPSMNVSHEVYLAIDALRTPSQRGEIVIYANIQAAQTAVQTALEKLR